MTARTYSPEQLARLYHVAGCDPAPTWPDSIEYDLQRAEDGAPRPEWRATRDRTLAILRATPRNDALPVLRGRRIA